MERNKTRDGELAAILRDILMVQAVHNIQLIVEHVKGESNPVADALSHVHMAKSVQCRSDLLSRGYREYVLGNDVFTLNLESGRGHSMPCL